MCAFRGLELKGEDNIKNDVKGINSTRCVCKPVSAGSGTNQQRLHLNTLMGLRIHTSEGNLTSWATAVFRNELWLVEFVVCFFRVAQIS
jgi:hypothetical protein